MTAAKFPSYDKPALSFADQVLVLQKRGMLIADLNAAERCLSSISYYRLSAYWHPFRKRDSNGTLSSQLMPDTSLELVLRFYEFDRKLRLLIMDALERIEVALRTAVTYQLGMAYDAFAHEIPANFHDKFDHAKWIGKLRDETMRSSDAFVAHFKNHYEGFPKLPIWMLTELISMGSLSILYKGMRADDKRAVAEKFHLPYKRLEDWLHVLTYVRNVCAHHSRLWNRELAIRPGKINENEWNAPLLPRNDRVFCVLLIVRHLLRLSGNSDFWRDQCNDLLAPIASERRWRIAMGMSETWQEHPLWK